MITTEEDKERLDQADQKALDAEREAEDAAGLVEALKERVRAGEDVTAAEIASARDVAEHAKLRAEAMERKAEATKTQIRKAKLDALATELADHSRDVDRFDKLFGAVEKSLEAFAQAAAERAEAVAGYRRVMHELDVPSQSPGVGQHHGLRQHAGLSWEERTGGMAGVAVNGRVLRPVDVGQFIAATVHRLSIRYSLRTGGGSSLHNVVPDLNGPNGPHDLHAYLRSLV